MYGKVALERGEIKFEDYFEATGQCLSIYAYSPLPGEFIAICTDVSERKQAEAALEASAEQFRALADSIPNLAWWANSDGYITWYNRRWYEYTGTTPEQMEGWGWQSVHDPNELPKVLERWQASIATGEPFDMTFPLRGADGVLRLFLTRVVPLKDADGRVKRWFGTNTDISELKRVEEALRLTQESIDCAAEMVAWFTPDGRVHYVNDATCRTLGYSRDELLQMTAMDFSPGFTWEQYQEHWQEVRERKSFSLETRHLRKDGSEYPAEVLVNYILYGGQEYIFAYGRDISERKRAEDTIKASLHEKEVMLKEIHHRVKNNLQVISSLVSLQAANVKDEAVRQVLQNVTYRVRSMAMVHEKLYKSADLANIDFAEYTRGLLSYLWRAHGTIAAAVRMTLDLEPVSLPTDTAVTCGLILNELAVNALEHAFQGRTDGEVTVSLHCGSDGRFHLCVADNGVGLPKGLDWRRSGTLGLRLVQMLCKQLDSTVEVSSGDGTKFEIVFEHSDSSPA